MENHLTENHDSVADDPLVPLDGLNDAAPPNNIPADPADQPTKAALPEAPGTPDANSSSNTPASPSSDAQSTNVPNPGTPEAPAPPTTNPPNEKEPRAKRPHSPDRANNLLKTNRDGIGGPATDAGKATSCMNNAKHGMYSRGPVRLMPWEDQDEFDDMAAGLRKQYEPINEASEQILAQLIQASWRLGRCDRAEYLAETTDAPDFDRYQRRVFGASSYRTRCERSYYLHYEKLKQLFADYKTEQEEIHQKMQEKELEKFEEASKPKPRFNADGEEMDPTYPQYSIWKLSCIPEGPCNEVYEFDRTLKGKMSVKRTPLRDWEGGRLLHPSFKPNGMKHDWPDDLLGPWKDYYKNLKKEENKDS